jgi:hypothetical protein
VIAGYGRAGGDAMGLEDPMLSVGANLQERSPKHEA